MVAVKEVVCNNANEIAIDEVEVSVPRKKAAGFAIQMLDEVAIKVLEDHVIQAKGEVAI